MKEQLQVPFDTNSTSDKEKEEGQAKSLGRPVVATSLQKPKLARDQTGLYRHCSCGNTACSHPSKGVSDGYVWVYHDRRTHEVIEDDSLPKLGGEIWLP